MKELNVDEVFIDKISGKSTDRPELKKMLEFVRKGDTVICESISRFARNTKDLLELIDTLNKKGVIFISKKEAIDTNTPTGKFMLTVFGQKTFHKNRLNGKTAIHPHADALLQGTAAPSAYKQLSFYRLPFHKPGLRSFNLHLHFIPQLKITTFDWP